MFTNTSYLYVFSIDIKSLLTMVEGIYGIKAKETFNKSSQTSRISICLYRQLGPRYIRLQVEHCLDMPTLPFVIAYPWSVYNALYQKDYRAACFPNGFHSLFMACISEVHSIHLQWKASA